MGQSTGGSPTSTTTSSSSTPTSGGCGGVSAWSSAVSALSIVLQPVRTLALTVQPFADRVHWWRTSVLQYVHLLSTMLSARFFDGLGYLQMDISGPLSGGPRTMFQEDLVRLSIDTFSTPILTSAFFFQPVSGLTTVHALNDVLRLQRTSFPINSEFRIYFLFRELIQCVSFPSSCFISLHASLLCAFSLFASFQSLYVRPFIPFRQHSLFFRFPCIEKFSRGFRFGVIYSGLGVVVLFFTTPRKSVCVILRNACV